MSAKIAAVREKPAIKNGFDTVLGAYAPKKDRLAMGAGWGKQVEGQAVHGYLCPGLLREGSQIAGLSSGNPMNRRKRLIVT